MPAQLPELRAEPASPPLFWGTALAMIAIAASFHLTRPDAWGGGPADAAWQPRPLHEVVMVEDQAMRPFAVVDGAVLYAPSGGPGSVRPAGGGGGNGRHAPAYVRVGAGRYLPVEPRR